MRNAWNIYTSAQITHDVLQSTVWLSRLPINKPLVLSTMSSACINAVVILTFIKVLDPTFQLTVYHHAIVVWPNSVMVRTLNLRVGGRGFHCQASCSHTHTCASVNKQYKLVPAKEGVRLRMGRQPWAWRRTGHASRDLVVYPIRPAYTPIRGICTHLASFL